MTDLLRPETAQPGWRSRTVLLMLIGAAAAWLVWWIMDMNAPYAQRELDPSILARRYALATGISVAAIAFGFGLERIRVRWTVTFALALGLVAGLILWWNNDGHGIWSWSGASLFLAIVIAVPLFQVARDEGRLSFPYSQIHGHAWTNVVLWFACWAFAGISMMLTVLLSELFKLIGITFLHDLLERGWLPALVIGGAFGAALGMFRDLDHVVRLLQRVVTSVLGFLAPVLGAALVLFILSLPFTGLNNLWESTKSTAPILLACVIGALVLANAVIGHSADDEAKSPVLRWSALALGVTVLPLALIAAIAIGLRLDQYGMTPDRLWGLIVVVFAVGYGIVYLVDAVRGRQGWAPLVRRDNIRLAFATMAAGLVMATPILGFNAISANDQVARLKSGKVSVDKFDWAALAFDFGEPGRRALAELRRSAIPAIATRATEVAKAKGRYDVADQDQARRDAATLAANVRILPDTVALPAELRTVVAQYGACGGGPGCVILYRAGATEAWVLQAGCFVAPMPGKPAPRSSGYLMVDYQGCLPQRYTFVGGKWESATTRTPQSADEATAPTRKAALDAGKVEVRTVLRRQLFIGDEPVGDPFE